MAIHLNLFGTDMPNTSDPYIQPAMTPQAVDESKVKRKRRTKAEMEAARLLESQADNTEPTQEKELVKEKDTQSESINSEQVGQDQSSNGTDISYPVSSQEPVPSIQLQQEALAPLDVRLVNSKWNLGGTYYVLAATSPNKEILIFIKDSD